MQTTAALGTVARVELVLEKAGEIIGTVADRGGAPVANLRVEARREDSTSGPGGTTDLRGEFSIAGLEPGAYAVAAASKWDLGSTSRVIGAPVRATVTRGAAARVALVVDRDAGALTGVVVDAAGAPVPDVAIDVALSSADLEPRRRDWEHDLAWSAADGSFRITNLPEHELAVRARIEGANEAVVESVKLGDRVRLVLKPTGVLAGVVTDPSGAPVEDVSLEIDDRAQNIARTERLFHTGGKFSFRELPAGSYRITADEDRLSVRPQLSLPARTSRLEIAYSELNLTSPLRTRFRYRLEGFDVDWVDAGTRRQAFYTNLPPRSYRFRVVPSNNDGTWAETGASWEFSIRPMFYQTTWFRASALAALGFSMWAGWQLRLRKIRRQYVLILGERMRLSRELHDTLLQSLVGVALQFDAVATDVESSSVATQKQFVRMRKQVEEYIREARQSIWDLRSPRLERRDLVAALRDVGQHVTEGHSITFALDVAGDPRRCSQKVEAQLLRIGQEAVTNAVRHARATHIQMALHYDEGSVSLQVIDNGCGFDHRAVVNDDPQHYGLMGMRERAEDVGGHLEVMSEARRGTQISAVVPLGGRA